MIQDVRLRRYGSILEWSIPSCATDPETAPKRRFYRVYVLIDPPNSTLIEIGDQQMTSDAENAQPIMATEQCVSLSLEEAEWLLEMLPQMIARVRTALAEQDREKSL